MSRHTRIGLFIFGLLVGALTLEIVLRLFVAVTEWQRTRAIMDIKDTRLGVRLNPRRPGIDARGWRNGSTLAHVDIVALGDSITYGFNVGTEAAWPQRLGRWLRRSVYQMAKGGYGPGQYLLLFDEAAALRPRVIIASYYLGNDLFDAFDLVYHTGAYKETLSDPVLDSLKSTDPNVRESTRRAEVIDPGPFRQYYLDCIERHVVTDPRLQQLHNVLTLPPLAPLADGPRVQTAARSWSVRAKVGSLLRHWLTYRIAHNAVERAVTRIGPSSRQDDGPPLCVHFRDQQVSTVLEAGFRLIAVDRTDPRVVEGERISLQAFKVLADRCRRDGIRFYVAMIPTKETAFRARAEASLRSETVLKEMWDSEASARAHAFISFREAGIDVIDTLPALEDVLASGTNPYGEDWNGHPIGPGYDAIARAIAGRLRHDGFGESP